MTMRRAVVAVVAVGALALAAVPVSTADAASANLDAARTGVLTISDFPAGWTQSDRAPATANNDATLAKIGACRAFRSFVTANHKRAQVRSPDFIQGQSAVTNAVASYGNDSSARSALKKFSTPKLSTCLARSYETITRAQLTPEVKKQVRSVVAEVRPVGGVTIGDGAAVYQGVVTVTLNNGSGERQGFGILYVRVGDLLDSFVYSTSSDISADLQPAIVKSVSRLQTAVSAG